MKIIDNIRQIAEIKNVKIMKLEKGIGVAYGFFSRVELRGKTLTLDKIKKVADFLGVSPLLIILPEEMDDQLLKLEMLITSLIDDTRQHKVRWSNRKTKYNDLKIELKDDSLYINNDRVMTKPVFERELSLLEAVIERPYI